MLDGGLGVAPGPVGYAHGDRESWGHGGDGIGSGTELRHVRDEKLTIAVTWNDDLLAGTEAGFLDALLGVVLPPGSAAGRPAAERAASGWRRAAGRSPSRTARRPRSGRGSAGR